MADEERFKLVRTISIGRKCDDKPLFAFLEASQLELCDSLMRIKFVEESDFVHVVNVSRDIRCYLSLTFLQARSHNPHVDGTALTHHLNRMKPIA